MAMKFFRDKGVSDDKQAGLYEGQIWGLRFARQAVARVVKGEQSPDEVQLLIGEAIRQLEQGLKALPTKVRDASNS